MFLAFFVAWIVFNGRFTLEVALFGVAVSAAVTAFCYRFLGYSLKNDIRIMKKSGQIIHYIGVLIWEILKAAAQVIEITVGGQAHEPVLVKFKTDLKTDTARVVLANSITLTPGTFTVELIGDEFTVHCLDKSMAEGMNDSVFVKLLRRMEG